MQFYIRMLFNNLKCCRKPTKLLAAMVPEAATAGIPIPEDGYMNKNEAWTVLYLFIQK